MSETFEQMALRVACEIGLWNPGDKNCMVDPIAFATRIKEELTKGQEPVAQVVAQGQYEFPHLQWKSANHSLETPIGSQLYLHPAPIPSTHVLVPKEPTEAMREAAWEVLRTQGEAVNLLYRDMLAAAQGE
jgi:hypothetical protein